MTKVDIFSGFLGAGKTTLIKKLISEAYGDEKIVLIENEFGQIGVDKGFLANTGVQINEMNAGCICCTLVGDFAKALDEVIAQYQPERILIEPSGVGKLSDVILAVQGLENENIELNGFTTVVDAKKCKLYMKNFGEFYKNQVEHASSIILSHTAGLSQEKIDAVIGMLRDLNKEATIVTTDWEQIDGSKILAIMEQKKSITAELEHLLEEARKEAEEHEHHHHHHHDHDEDCDCGCHDHDHEHEHHHHHDHEEHGEDCTCGCHDHEHEHEHHHHHDHEEHGEDCTCGCHDHEHEHHHDHDHEHHHHHHDHEEHGEDCTCGCHDHDHEHHHHHHHADEVFDQIGVETAHKYTEAQLQEALEGLQNFAECGQVLRAKGIVEGVDGGWFQFDYVPGEPEVRTGEAEATGMICVIGVGLEQDRIRELFGL